MSETEPYLSRQQVEMMRKIHEDTIRNSKEYLAELDGERKKHPDTLDAEYVHAKMIMRKEKGIGAIPTGFPWWDNSMGPFRRGDLYGLAGYPGTGKTTFAVNLTWPMALAGIKVWNVCLEMTGDEMYEVVAGHVMKKATLSEAEFETAKETIQACGYYFYEPQRDMSWEETIERICYTVRRENVGFVVIDNFSYLTSVARNTYETERVVAKALKGLAQELEIPILVIAHLRKPDRDDTEPNPTAHSVLGSGALNQVASDTFILHHPLTGSEDVSRHPIGYVFSGKPRWGKGGKRYVYYAGDKRKFYEATAEGYRSQFPEKSESRRLKHDY